MTTIVNQHIRAVTCAALFIGAPVIIGVAFVFVFAMPTVPAQSIQCTHPVQPVRYLGVFEPDAPNSYVGVDQFAHGIGRQPNLVTYYSHWFVPFQVNFATAAARHGAITLVQIAPRDISLASITSGRYDDYLRSYAAAVKKFGAQVILSFGHEMNGNWYSWGYQHSTPAEFVDAWRHIVTIFRKQGTRNVTWLWTVNIVNPQNNHIPDPAPWWPGSSYVNWVGIDGYYYYPSWTFASLFGPTITKVRELTRDPILIAETGAASSTDQPAKIADLFAGVRAYGLLGFVWFNQDGVTKTQDWRISDPSAYAAFCRAAMGYTRHLS